MMGGVKRWATAIRSLGDPSATVILENGGLVEGSGPQDRMKAQTMGIVLGSVGATALNLTSSDAKLGAAELSQIDQLAGGVLVSSSVSGAPRLEAPSFREKGPFLIGGAVANIEKVSALGGTRIDATTAARNLLAEARGKGRTPVLMLDGDEAEATALAKAVPGIGLIVYSRGGNPPQSKQLVGSTVLVTPGDKGKFLVRISFVDGKFEGYTQTALWPAVKDDPEVSVIYSSYLRQVERSTLLEALPRKATAGYVGSEKCGSCHAQDYHTWSLSRHSKALASLEAERHGRDPDCVSCHVTGLESDHGYRSRTLTPALAKVGCESCHGPGEAHSAQPKLVKLPKVGAKSCSPCHVAENSPNFDFLTYWQKIKH
jgi:hypothetical protein